MRGRPIGDSGSARDRGAAGTRGALDPRCRPVRIRPPDDPWASGARQQGAHRPIGHRVGSHELGCHRSAITTPSVTVPAVTIPPVGTQTLPRLSVPTVSRCRGPTAGRRTLPLGPTRVGPDEPRFHGAPTVSTPTVTSAGSSNSCFFDLRPSDLGQPSPSRKLAGPAIAAESVARIQVASAARSRRPTTNWSGSSRGSATVLRR